MSLNDLLGSAMDIRSNTTKEAVSRERDTITTQNVDVTNVESNFMMRNSEFLYPTIITVPLIIVIISLMALNISLFTKLVLILFIIIALGTYILQFKKINIEEPLTKLSNSLKKKLNLHNTIRPESSYIFKD